jgi:hypothetical protein
MISAAVSCRDYQKWVKTLGADGGAANGASVKDLPDLQAAFSAAPSGQLYADLGNLYSVVKVEGPWLPDSVQAWNTVDADCQSINPNS